MKKHKWFFASLAVLFSLFMTASCSNLEGGTVIITNNSNKEYVGRVVYKGILWILRLKN